MRDTYPDGSYPQVIDELTYNIRRKLFQDLSKSTVTIRHNSSQTAVPYRQLAAFLPAPASAAPACIGRACISASIRSNCACAATMKSATAKLYSEGHDHPGLRRDLRRAGTVLRQSGESVRHLRHRLDHQRAEGGAEGRQPLCGGSLQRLPAAGAEKYLLRPAVRKRRWRWVITHTTCRPPIPRTLTPTRTARRWARATSAVSAAATPATCIPKLRRTSTFCRRCAWKNASSYAPTPTC